MKKRMNNLQPNQNHEKLYLIPLLFLTACSTAPKLTLRPQQPPATMEDSAIRYPEVVRAYHVGRYVDPNDDLVMHEQHVVYRVEENTRWNFHPGPDDGIVPALPPAHDAAFAPPPVNDAILAEVNSQRIRHRPNHGAGAGFVVGTGAGSNHFAGRQNQLAGDGGHARSHWVR